MMDKGAADIVAEGAVVVTVAEEAATKTKMLTLVSKTNLKINNNHQTKTMVVAVVAITVVVDAVVTDHTAAAVAVVGEEAHNMVPNNNSKAPSKLLVDLNKADENARMCNNVRVASNFFSLWV
jgi:hypothetical protein